MIHGDVNAGLCDIPVGLLPVPVREGLALPLWSKSFILLRCCLAPDLGGRGIELFMAVQPTYSKVKGQYVSQMYRTVSRHRQGQDREYSHRPESYFLIDTPPE